MMIFLSQIVKGPYVVAQMADGDLVIITERQAIVGRGFDRIIYTHPGTSTDRVMELMLRFNDPVEAQRWASDPHRARS